MALTDAFLTQFLVQETEAAVDPIRWLEMDSGGYRTERNGITIQLLESHTRSGTLLCLELTSGADKAFICEPQSTAIFGRKYKDEDERSLAEWLRKLERAVAVQCERRRQHACSHAKEIREQMIQTVVFGSESKVGSR